MMGKRIVFAGAVRAREKLVAVQVSARASEDYYYLVKACFGQKVDSYLVCLMVFCYNVRNLRVN